MKPGAVTVPIALRDLSDSPVAGATLACTVSIDGGAFAPSTNTATEVGGGDYALALTAAERGTSYSRIKATDGTYTTLVTVTTNEAMRGTDGALTDKTGFSLTAAYDHAKDDVLTPLAEVAEAPVALAADQPLYAPTTWRDLEGLATATALATVGGVVDEIAADYAKTGEAAAAAQAVIEALPVAESIPAEWVTITEATLDDDDEPLGVASVGGSTADALGMRIEAITGGALMNATTVGNTLGTYALPVEPGHTYTLRFALPGAAMAERTVTIA